jgi:hypothetical protein
MAARPQFELTIQGEQAPVDPYTNKVCTSKLLKQAFTAGVADNQMDTLYKDSSDASGTIGTSATLALDLQTALDALGVAMTLTDVALVYIEHPASSLASSISVQASGANGFTNLLAATANFTIPAGGFLLFYMPVADAMVVSGTNKSLDIINDDGAQVASYVIEVWGRK